MYSNSFLHAHFERVGQQTVLTHRAFSAPLKIKKTFQQPGSDALTLYMMDASPGMMEGDRYEIVVHLKENSHAIVTNQASTKIHPSKIEGSCLYQLIELEAHATLEYFPEPTILYRDSLFKSNTHINIAATATLCMADIITCGRVERDERFEFQTYSAKTQLYYEGKLIAYEHNRFTPLHFPPEQIGIYESFTHQAIFWIVSANITPTFEEGIYEAIKIIEHSRLLAAHSRFEPYAIAIRILGNTVWEIQAFIQSIWEHVRMSLLQLPPYQFRK